MKRKQKRVFYDRGGDSYWLRLQSHDSWDNIAIALDYKNHRGAFKAAKRYATEHYLPWPLAKITKGDAAYRARRIGMTWLAIGRRYKQSASSIRRCAYKHAQRNDLIWPPEVSYAQR